VHLPSIDAIQPYFARTLPKGYPSAQERDHLRLLPSGPDRVHGRPSRRTLRSTRRYEAGTAWHDLKQEFDLAI